jgi:MFS family permease
MMPKKHLAALFVCSLTSFTIGNSVIGLLPVYVNRLGGDPALTGYFFAFVFLSLAVGTMLAGWLSERFQNRKLLLILSGIPGIPITWLMSQVTDLTQLALLNSISTVFGGIGLALVNILAGLFAPDHERGKVFGILAFASALGGLVGGFASGPIADRWGFPALLQILALWSILYPLAALFVADKQVDKQPSVQVSGTLKGLGRAYYMLFAANIIAWTAVFVPGLGRPLAMDALGFDATAVSSTVAVGAAVTLPLPPLLGWLSDRIGRKRLMALCYLAGGLGLVVQAGSVSIWHFWLASVLTTCVGTSVGVGLALVTDLVPLQSRSMGVALFSSTNLLAGMLGFAVAGHVIGAFGLAVTFVAAAFLPLVSILMLGLVKQPSQQPVTT